MKENITVPGYQNFEVRLRKNESTETLIKRFLKKTKKERIVEEVMERSRYKKPAVLKREAFFKRQNVLEKMRIKEQEALLLLDQ